MLFTNDLLCSAYEFIPRHLVPDDSGLLAPLRHIEQSCDEPRNIVAISECDGDVAGAGNRGRSILNVDGNTIRVQVRFDMGHAVVVHEETVDDECPFQIGLVQELQGCKVVFQWWQDWDQSENRLANEESIEETDILLRIRNRVGSRDETLRLVALRCSFNEAELGGLERVSFNAKGTDHGVDVVGLEDRLHAFHIGIVDLDRVRFARSFGILTRENVLCWFTIVKAYLACQDEDSVSALLLEDFRDSTSHGAIAAGNCDVDHVCCSAGVLSESVE